MTYQKKNYNGLDNFLHKFTFWNTKIVAIAFTLNMLWIILAIVFLARIMLVELTILFNDLAWLVFTWIVSTGGVLLFVIVAFIGKIIYSRKKIKCDSCGYVSRADKYYCGNCGEKLVKDNETVF